MKPVLASLALALVLASLLACTPAKIDHLMGPPPANDVSELFAHMEAGTYRMLGGFPKNLTWDHIPALIQLADSTRILKSMPVNLLSSQHEVPTSEGMVAMWLIEGIRKTPKPDFPSLNPLCLPTGPNNNKDWNALSEQNHGKVAAAYKKWWTEVGSVSEEQGRKTNPLAGTGLYWY